MAIEIDYKRDCCTWFYDFIKLYIFLAFSAMAGTTGLESVFWGKPEFLYSFQMAYSLLPPFAQEGSGAVQFGNSVA